ncbi:hypothetical protein O3M35_008181 [Rhynocoris fuscipes]|uniref:Phosphotransferase n=1 Tax=Rhynocoris fuscipes TaxID=488301 RepID=A0AAW1D630_9HEMI
MKKGMRDEKSSLFMENTYVPELLNGTESGRYLALDLGGTNFRLLLVEMLSGKITKEIVKPYEIKDEARIGCGLKLFDFLAECISDFTHENGVADLNLPLGFTFSFPMHQKSIHNGILLKWTKSFAATNVEGNDVVIMLQEAIERRGDVKVDINAVLNDTTGTLLKGCLLDPRTRIGMIIGTGTNACYMERADRISHWESERHGEKEVLIDIEWGAFGDNGTIDFVKTYFDRQLDSNSLYLNSFSFEKLISGLYLGELVRIILVHLTNNRLLFNGILSKKIQEKNSFPSSQVSLIEEDNVNNTITNTEKILKDLNLKYTMDDLKIVKYVCELVSLRGALLLSACLSTLIHQIDKDDVTIAVDGSLYKFHPRMKIWINKFVKLLAPAYEFRLLLAEDGSGKGAAIASAIALRLQKSYTIH